MQIVHRRHVMHIGFFRRGHGVVGVGCAAMIAAGCVSAQVPLMPTPPPPASVPAPVASSPAYAWPDHAVARARAVVDTLASDAFADPSAPGTFVGRGYDYLVGADRAALWASGHLRAVANVHPVTSHSFEFTLNAVEEVGIVVDGHRLGLGVDVLPFAETRRGGAARPLCSPEAVVTECIVVLADGGDVRSRIDEAAQQGARAAVVLADALPPYSPAPATLSIPAVVVRRGAWPETPREAHMVVVSTTKKANGANVLASIRGSAVPDSFVVVTAHLDHLGRIYDPFSQTWAVFGGANDNASGVAAALALADTLARRPLRYTTVIALTGGEEHGLHGATALVRRPLWPLDRTRLVVNLDMVASGESGIGVFGAAEQPAVFAAMQAIAAQKTLGPLSGRAMRPNSDQYPFFEAGVPAVYLLTLGGRQPYHSVADVPETLEWDDWARVVALAHGTLRHVTGGD